MKMQGDSIISALIGLVGAVSNNGKTEQTDRVIREAFLCLTDAGSSRRKGADNFELVVQRGR